MNRSGLSLIEVLIALSIIGIAFVALALSQLTSLRASVDSRFVTEAKAAGSQVLEQQMAEVLRVETRDEQDSYTDQVRFDDYGNPRYQSFYFIDYYYQCPTSDTTNAPRDSFRTVDCDGQTQMDGERIAADWSIAGEGGVLGEGIITVTVTAKHEQGTSITLVDVITCYDVYPSPTNDTPKPCPTPTASGGGRTGE